MIFLIGMPGAGKSYWLHPFSEVINFNAVDLDEEIERKYQRKIARVFKNKEEEFRMVERDMLKNIINTSSSSTILATGGGTPCYFDNLHLMKKNGKVIYLKADNQLLFDRLAKDLNKRPFLPKTKIKLIEYLDQLEEERSPYYEQADLILPVKYLNITFFLDQIKPLLNS